MAGTGIAGCARPTRDGDLEVGEAGVDEGRVVVAQVQCARDVVAGDVQGAGGVEEVPPDPVGGGVFVPGQLEDEQPAQVPGDHGQRGVLVYVEVDAGGKRVEVEPADVGIQLVSRHQPHA